MQTPNSILVYNVFSGSFYKLPDSDINLLQVGHLPLLQKPKSCKKCFNRGFLGREARNLTYSPCSCVQKVLNLDILKTLENKHTQLS
jgi:hypothetical protein